MKRLICWIAGHDWHLMPTTWDRTVLICHRCYNTRIIT